MYLLVQKVGLLPEMLKSLVESSSPKVVNKSQIESQIKIIASQEKEINDLQSLIQNLRNTNSSQDVLISTQKLKIATLKKDVETKSKQLEMQSSELNNLRVLQLKDSKLLNETRQIAEDKSLIISDQKCKIATLTSRNNSLNINLKEKLKKFLLWTKHIATQSREIGKLKRDIEESLRDIQGNVLKELNQLESLHAINVDRIKNLRLEVAKKDHQLRLQVQNTTSDLNELAKYDRERTKKLQKLSRQLDEKCEHLQEKDKIVQEMNLKLVGQSLLSNTLVSKIETMQNDVQSKEDLLQSQRKETHRLRTEIRDIPTGVKAQVTQILQKYKPQIVSDGGDKADQSLE